MNTVRCDSGRLALGSVTHDALLSTVSNGGTRALPLASASASPYGTDVHVDSYVVCCGRLKQGSANRNILGDVFDQMG